MDFSQTITFIGAGNMASCLIGGLHSLAWPADHIIAAAPAVEHLERLASKFGIQTSQDNQSAIAAADIVVLAVKPQQMRAVCEQLAACAGDRPRLFVSVAAGTTIASIQDWLGGDYPVVRCMPNTPASVAEGASALFATARVEPQQREFCSQLFNAIGSSVWLEEEDQMHLVTALSGSGPAYYFLLLEAFEEAAQALGLELELARSLAAQTMLGAAKLAQQSELTPAALKQQVMSPGGTTEKGIEVLEQADIRDIIRQTLVAACQRSKELSALT